MSSIWTPGGERPVGRQGAGGNPAGGNPQEGQGGPVQGQQGRAPAGFGEEPGAMPSEAEAEAQMEELRRQLSETPAELVIANHCFGLFELAALHLSNRPPKLGEAQLAIDALGALVENLRGRLGEPEAQLNEGLQQLRLAFVNIRKGNDGQPQN